MKMIAALFLLAAGLWADAPADAVHNLYDTGLRQTQEGKLEAARQTLQGLMDSYPRHPLALQARGAIDATLLFEEGRERTKAGKYETARLAYETLIAVYPENPLALRAKSAIQTLDAKQRKKSRVVKAVEFRGVTAVPVAELRAAMVEREVRLCEGKPYREKDVEEARTVLESILAEKGAPAKLQTTTRNEAEDSIAVTFSAEKPRASLFRRMVPGI